MAEITKFVCFPFYPRNVAKKCINIDRMFKITIIEISNLRVDICVKFKTKGM